MSSGALQCSTVQYSTVQYSKVQCRNSAVQCGVVTKDRKLGLHVVMFEREDGRCRGVAGRGVGKGAGKGARDG